MPARNEIEVCYFNLKPTTAANNSSWGINANAVPTRTSNYTSVDPAQTSAAAFVTSTGAEAFITGVFYWSSTEASSTTSWSTYFTNGSQSTNTKTGSYRVRAVRRVAV